MAAATPAQQQLVAIRGAGDIAAAWLCVCMRVQSGDVGVAKPTVIRRSVAFKPKVFDGEMTVEGGDGEAGVIRSGGHPGN